MHLSCDCPWRKKHFQADLPDLPRHMVSVTDMVHQILGCAPPDGAPRHGHRHNWANSKWWRATCRYISHVMIVPQKMHGAGCFCRYFSLAALRICSRSRCRHIIWLITAVGHLCINSANSDIKTCDSGKSPMSTIVTSWKSSPRQSGTSTRILRGSLPCVRLIIPTTHQSYNIR